MQRYLKLFQTHSEYLDYINGQNAILPNVSYCIDNQDVHYNPWARLIVTYTDEDDSEPTLLFSWDDQADMIANKLFSKIEVDDEVVSLSSIDNNSGTYQLSEGTHTVKYTLIDPTTIEGRLFGLCTNLTSVTIPNTITEIGTQAFYGCTGLTTVTMGNGIRTIGKNAFQNCYSLTSIAIPNSVRTISWYAFEGCEGLTSVTIPNSVSTIGNYAFRHCSSLTNITIPNTVTSIGSEAFNGCTGLTSVTVLATTPPTLGGDAFLYNASGRKIYVPSASVNTYKTTDRWSHYSNAIQAIPTT